MQLQLALALAGLNTPLAFALPLVLLGIGHGLLVPPALGGTVGLLLMRSYVLAGNADHYNGVITAIEARGLRVIPAFATGLDQRPAIDAYFFKDGPPGIDALVSLTGFSLVGGPAYNDARAAEDILAKLDVPYLAVTPVEFQTLDQWGSSERGLLPVESTIMVAIPELDGATGPVVFGGRPGAAGVTCQGHTVEALHPWEAILEQAKTQGCDLIVMASHGRRGVSALLLGSETQRVLIHTTLPVLVVR